MSVLEQSLTGRNQKRVEVVVIRIQPWDFSVTFSKNRFKVCSAVCFTALLFMSEWFIENRDKWISQLRTVHKNNWWFLHAVTERRSVNASYRDTTVSVCSGSPSPFCINSEETSCISIMRSVITSSRPRMPSVCDLWPLLMLPCAEGLCVFIVS